MGRMRWVTKAKCVCTCQHVSIQYVCVRMDRADPPRTRPSPNARWTVLEACEEGTPPPPQTLPWREMDDFKS